MLFASSSQNIRLPGKASLADLLEKIPRRPIRKGVSPRNCRIVQLGAREFHTRFISLYPSFYAFCDILRIINQIPFKNNLLPMAVIEG